MTSVEASPTARALVVLDLLQRSPGITADRLAARLGVTDRAARRYVAILREAGIPVQSNPGRYGGYRIGRALHPAPFVFTATEALGLVMAVLDGQHAAADPHDPVGSALGKLIQALPVGVARPAATMRAHARAVPDRGAARPDPSFTTDLVSAIAAARRVRLSYRGPSGSHWEDVIDPWAVVVRYGRWYLLCRAHRADAVRTFRVDRIRTVHILDETFLPPDDLDPVGMLEDNLGVRLALSDTSDLRRPVRPRRPAPVCTVGASGATRQWRPVPPRREYQRPRGLRRRAARPGSLPIPGGGSAPNCVRP